MTAPSGPGAAGSAPASRRTTETALLAVSPEVLDRLLLYCGRTGALPAEVLERALRTELGMRST